MKGYIDGIDFYNIDPQRYYAPPKSWSPEKIKDVTTITDYFVIASGTSSTHIKALADNLEYELKEDGIYPNKIEGYETGTWILLDYADVVVHIFTEQERQKYKIEELWDNMKNKLKN